MHSDQDYFVDQSLFGSSIMRNPSTITNESRNQIICRGECENLQEQIQMLLDIIGVRFYQDQITILNMKDSCVLKFKNPTNCEPTMKKLIEKIQQSNLRITVDWHEPKDERNVYVRNLPLDFTDALLKELFQGIGFVRYQNKVDATKAIQDINNKNIHLIGLDRAVQCELSKAYNSSGATPMYNSETPSSSSMNQHVPQMLYSSDVSNSYNLSNQSIMNFEPSQNITLVHPIQLPQLYTNTVPIQVVYAVPQPQIFQQEYHPNPVLYTQLNPYNTQNN